MYLDEPGREAAWGSSYIQFLLDTKGSWSGTSWLLSRADSASSRQPRLLLPRGGCPAQAERSTAPADAAAGGST